MHTLQHADYEISDYWMSGKVFSGRKTKIAFQNAHVLMHLTIFKLYPTSYILLK